MGDTKHYQLGDLTVAWQPSKCIHSTHCWRGLPRVFNPRKRPWVNMEAAGPDAIIEQVNKCPSGALSYIQAESPAENTEPEMPETEPVYFEMLPNGPLKIERDVCVRDAAGNEFVRKEKAFLCRCGGSANKPFCDGSHRNIGFEG